MLLCASIREVKVKKVYFLFEAPTPTVFPIGDYSKIFAEIDLTFILKSNAYLETRSVYV